MVFPSRLVLASLVTSMVAALGCGSTSNSDATSPFNGTWNCKGTSTITRTEPTTGSETSNTSSSTPITVSGGAFTVMRAITDGGAECSLTFTTSGSSATLNPGQTCMATVVFPNSTANVTVSFTTGSATVSGNTLTVASAASYTGMDSKGAVSVAVAGTESSGSTCTK
jgi:hypothetical protein